MREDEDIRQYMPVLRRLIILVAVITAIPVVMWTITAMVRTYVGPPKLPTFRPIAAAPATAGPDQAAAAVAPSADDSGRGARQPVQEANAATSDAVTGTTADTAVNGNAAPAGALPGPAAQGSFQTASLPSGDGAAKAAPAPGGGASQFAPEDRQAATSWPAPPATTWPGPATQQPVAAAAGDAHPIDGPVPLPRKRPRVVAIAEAHGIPLPRPRPDAAGPAVAEQQQQATPVDWLRNIFNKPPAAAAPAAGDEYQAEPH